MNTDNTLILRTSIKNRVIGAIAGTVFVGIGIFCVIDGHDTIVRIAGLFFSLFGVYVLFTLIYKSRALLVVDSNGIIPVYFVGKRMTYIPWSNIRQFGKATKQIPRPGMNSNLVRHFVAVYFNEPQELTRGFWTALLHTDPQHLRHLISDGGTADLYIPAIFSEPLDDVVQTLEKFRLKSK